MMSKLGVFLTRQELRVVFDTFDANKDGNIAWAEFVEGLKVSHYSPSGSVKLVQNSNCLNLTSFDLITRSLINLTGELKLQRFRLKKPLPPCN